MSTGRTLFLELVCCDDVRVTLIGSVQEPENDRARSLTQLVLTRATRKIQPGESIRDVNIRPRPCARNRVRPKRCRQTDSSHGT